MSVSIGGLRGVAGIGIVPSSVLSLRVRSGLGPSPVPVLVLASCRKLVSFGAHLDC